MVDSPLAKGIRKVKGVGHSTHLVMGPLQHDAPAEMKGDL
jgi:hypothetical protein